MKFTYLPVRFSLKNYPTGRKEKGSFLFNICAFLIVASMFSLITFGMHEMTASISVLKSQVINLNPSNLFEYSFRTSLRMFIAMIFSIIFALSYATFAAKNKRAEQILIPLLDILQSVPILGYISFTATGFLLLFPNSILGAEAAAIFAIFTSQTWNLTFSFYQSLKTTPKDLIEASYVFKISKWQRFWRVELPFGIPGLIGNMIVSMSGGWFFVVAAEVINVGNNSIVLPGIGSYISLALEQKNILAIFYAIASMGLVIIIYDQLILRTLVAWADKFRYENYSGNPTPSSWMLKLFRKNLLIKKILWPLKYIADFILYIPIFNIENKTSFYHTKQSAKNADYLWYFILTITSIIAGLKLYQFLHQEINIFDIINVVKLVFMTMIRVVLMVILASIIWVPIGIYIGLNSKLASKIQPIIQFLGAFPANLLFPVAVILITRFDLNPNIWLSPLIIIGAQWYILFNVIAGSAALPNELKEISLNLNIKGFLWLRRVMIPAIIPYLITGAITASGGAWNASIVAEIVTWGDKTIFADGIGSYISQMTLAGDVPRIVLGIGIMSLFVASFNHFFWQPLYNWAANKYKF